MKENEKRDCKLVERLNSHLWTFFEPYFKTVHSRSFGTFAANQPKMAKHDLPKALFKKQPYKIFF